MADFSEKDDKTTSPTDDSTLSLSANAPPTREFAPILNASKTNSRSNSQVRNNYRSGSLRTLSLTRSNNGYGCDDHDDVEAADDGEKDPFEVHWENGEEDPLNPKSKRYFQKWDIVIIVSLSSLCV